MNAPTLELPFARSILEALPAFVLVLEPAGCIEYVNPAFESLTGTALADVRGQEWCSTCLPHRDRARTRGWLSACFEGPTAPPHIAPIITTSSTERLIAWHARVVASDRGPRLVCVGSDVGERKEERPRPSEAGQDDGAAARALAASESRLRRAQHVGRIGSWEYEPATDSLNWSEEMYRLVEVDPRLARPSRQVFHSCVHPDDRALLADAIQRARDARLPHCLLHRLLMADGRIKWVENRWDLERDQAGVMTRIVGTLQDVTERWRAEDEVRRAHDLLRAAIDSSPDFVFAKDRDYRYVLVNRAFAERCGSTVDAMLGRRDVEVWPPRFSAEGAADARIRASDDRALAGETVRETLEIGTRQEGHWRAYDAIKLPLRDREGQPYGVLVYARETTEQLRLQEAQARALNEKETLLREIHHRVKNNLQIVSSLLHFQAKKVGTPIDRMAFEDGRKRLIAMMLVHEKLYQANDLSAVEFSWYARSLFTTLAASFEIGDRIRTRFSAADIRLPVEVAQPLGLILCELITNAFKYAFPADSAGLVDVSIAVAPSVSVEVRDDGVGLPVDFDPRATQSFGWHLVNTLVQQLGAELHVDRQAGTSVRVVLPLGASPDAPGGRVTVLH